MEFFKHFLGAHSLYFHLAGLIFSTIGVLIAKSHFYLKHKAECKITGHDHKFKLFYWINDNGWQVIISLLASFVAVRFLDVLLHWLNPKIEGAFNFSLPLTEDQIFYYFIIGFLLQFWVHKKYKK